jgi:hypothetical protein
MNKTIIVILLLCQSLMTFAQRQPTLDWDFFSEFYAGVDDLQSKTHQRPSFLYNHTRSEELAINVALIHAVYEDSLWRAKGGLMTGSYVERNLATESPILQHLYEASVGVRLQAKRDLWLETGVFPSHLGYETIIGSDNPTMTRSLIAENSPYYESGVRLAGRSINKKWSYALLALNGWQRISRPAGYYPPSVGWQVKLDPNAHWSFNYSGYVGDESPDGDIAMRMFHDFFVSYKTDRGCMIVASIDAGIQPNLLTEDRKMATWYGGLLMASVPMGKKWKINGRVEQYIDDQEIIVTNPFDDGFHLKGYSLGLDYQIQPAVSFRIEGKRMDGPGLAFIQRDEQLTNVAHLLNLGLLLRVL